MRREAPKPDRVLGLVMRLIGCGSLHRQGTKSTTLLNQFNHLNLVYYVKVNDAYSDFAKALSPRHKRILLV
jgi:hypothetical protein